MKNIIFNVFGEDMSTGVVTQVNSVCSHKYAIAYLSFFFFGELNLLRANRGARNPNLQVSIAHAWHVCGQHSTKNERNLITSVAFAPSITRNNARFDPHHVKLT